MAETTFGDIHGDGGGAIATGPSLDAFVAADNAAAGADASGTDGGGAGRGQSQPLPRLAAFGVYWDQSERNLDMVDPLVVGPKGTITCSLPDGIADGTYYCNVLMQKSSGTYIAKVEASEGDEEEGYEKVSSVKLFTLNGEAFTQHHMGAVFVPAAKKSDKDSAFQAVPVYDTDGTTLDHWEIRNCYYMRAGVMAKCGNFTVLPDAAAGNYICLLVYMTSSIADIACVSYPAGMQYNASYYMVPLYKADSTGKELVDLRTMPQLQVFEVGLS